MKNTSLALIGVFALILGACGTKDAAQASSSEVEKLSLESVERAHRVGDIVMTSQPKDADFSELKNKFNIKTVVNLRLPTEIADLNEPQRVRDLGLVYENIAFKGPETLSDQIFADVRTTLKDKSRQPLVLHCKSANRVGAVWYAFRVLDQGISKEQAMAEAKTIGLRKEGHIKRAQDYVDKKLR
ncbi:MAG: hypothetical protein V3W41_11550 [Planctomycetota bacterium]